MFEEFNDKQGMAKCYSNIGLVLRDQDKYQQAWVYHSKSLAIHEELNDRLGMAEDYGHIGVILASLRDGSGAIELFSKGLGILEELEKKTGYHHPLSDTYQRILSRITKTKK
jgi:hypothetical protein